MRANPITPSELLELQELRLKSEKSWEEEDEYPIALLKYAPKLISAAERLHAIQVLCEQGRDKGSALLWTEAVLNLIHEAG